MESSKNPFKNDEIESENIEQKEENIEETTEETKEEQKEENFKEKFEELNNKYLRLAADFDNFRKRTAQEKEELSVFANVQMLKQIITVLDTFDRAREHLKDIEDCKIVKDSYEVAFNQFVDTLKKLGMEEIDALGKPFNPNEHEAVTQVATSEYEPDTVALVAQKGYKLQDRVIRAALVGVAKKEEE